MPVKIVTESPRNEMLRRLVISRKLTLVPYQKLEQHVQHADDGERVHASQSRPAPR